MQSTALAVPASPAHAADPLFRDRWSPRAFTDEPVRREDLQTLFDAARYAPSSFNEQPWAFVYATTTEDRERFLPLLNEWNQAWARHAPVLAFLAARKTAGSGDAPNPAAKFDAGAAWMSLALQARLLGLDTHAIGGIDRDRAHDVLGFPRKTYDVLVAIAIGRRAEPSALPPILSQREGPSPRKPLADIAREGLFEPVEA